MNKRAQYGERRNPVQDERRVVNCLDCGEEFHLSNNYTGVKFYCPKCRKSHRGEE